ncbi:MAG: sigma 54-interacting transcriptional regulator [Agrobacterium sp.]|nr:sigma 54-interacting transcriptional regulator [Agrobacterium sp.]
MAINCAALPETLIESELFGHEAGAFPGALRPRYGKFEHARGGTILLDEIGSMPLRPAGASCCACCRSGSSRGWDRTKPVALDVRFIATSKVDLEQEVAAGRFRADLLYRLNVATLRVPPLASAARRHSAAFPASGAGSRCPLTGQGRHDDPRNCWRTLPRATGRAMCANCAMRRTASCWALTGCPRAGCRCARWQGGAWPTEVAAYERSLIARAIAVHGGNLKSVYESLGISRKTLYEKMQKYELRPATDPMMTRDLSRPYAGAAMGGNPPIAATALFRYIRTFAARRAWVCCTGQCARSQLVSRPRSLCARSRRPCKRHCHMPFIREELDEDF